MLQIKTLSCKEELAVLEEENAAKRKKLEEVAALDGRTPEGVRRWLQCNEKASSGGTVQRINFQTFNFNLTFAEESLLDIQSSKWQLLNLKVNPMLNCQERAAEDSEAGVG